jgi:Integrase core domain
MTALKWATSEQLSRGCRIFYAIFLVVSLLIDALTLWRKASNDKDLEIMALRHQLRVCQRHSLPDVFFDHTRSFTHLIRDNDGEDSIGFDAVFASQGVEVVRTPIQAPRANAYAERWMRSVREECLDRIIILNQAHRVYALRNYDQYFNEARPHQGIKQCIPCPPTPSSTTGEVE